MDPNGTMIHKRKLLIGVCGFLLFGSVSLGAQTERQKVAKANELYNAERYEEALTIYRDAALDDPESAAIRYNIGNTLYKQGKFEEAFQEYTKVLSAQDADLHFRSYYNMGNTLYRMNKLEESILSYTKALQINPDDYDSKFNLEFVRNKLKQQMQDQQQDQQQQQEGEQQQDEQRQQQGEQQQNEQEQQQDQQEGEQQQQEQPQGQQDEREMTREEAERILNALMDNERDIQEKRKAPAAGSTRVKIDW